LARVAWTLIFVALVSQALAWLVFGHAAYLWVQGAEALIASVALAAFGARYWRQDTRESRWPPLLPLAAIAATGGVKDFRVALGASTPAWLVALLLTAVVWFVGASWMIWRTENRSARGGRTGEGL
jgi:hypothetical protein